MRKTSQAPARDSPYQLNDSLAAWRCNNRAHAMDKGVINWGPTPPRTYLRRHHAAHRLVAKYDDKQNRHLHHNYSKPHPSPFVCRWKSGGY